LTQNHSAFVTATDNLYSILQGVKGNLVRLSDEDQVVSLSGNVQSSFHALARSGLNDAFAGMFQNMVKSLIDAMDDLVADLHELDEQYRLVKQIRGRISVEYGH
jgi:hypothetical protein